MSSSLYVTCQSDGNDKVYTENSPSNFRNKISVENWPTQLEVALIYLDVAFKEDNTYNVVSVNLHNIIPQENGSNHSDYCIYMLRPTLALPHRIYHPIYYPMFTDNLNCFHISLQDEKGKLIEVDTYEESIQVFVGDGQGNNISVLTLEKKNKQVVCVLHLRAMSFTQHKVIRTTSISDVNFFPSNNPFCYKNKISPIMHEHNDYTDWEIALESIFIDHRVMKKVKDASTILISLDVIKEQMQCDGKSYVLDRIPAKYVDKKTFSYTPLPNHFVDINVRLLSQITVKLDFYANDNSLTETEIVWQEAEKKKATVIVNFLLRKKLYH